MFASSTRQGDELVIDEAKQAQYGSLSTALLAGRSNVIPQYVQPQAEDFAPTNEDEEISFALSGPSFLNDDPDDEELLLETLFSEQLDGPKFTEEQEQAELKQTTEEERLSVLEDLFGDYCEISQPPKKRVVREERPISVSIQSLVHKMRSEIEATPLGQKTALVEALQKCSPNEFSDNRMKLFLFRENMNSKVRAYMSALRMTNECIVCVKPVIFCFAIDGGCSIHFLLGETACTLWRGSFLFTHNSGWSFAR